jgi:hypothetical protein
LDDPANPQSPTARLKSVLRRRLQLFEERRFASRVCDEVLAALAAARAQQPGLHGDALYAAVIARRLKLDAPAAHLLLRRIQDGHQDWESERAARFIDVVRYMIVREYLAREDAATGMSLDLGAFLAERIDPRL